MSATDVEKINRLYQCPQSLSSTFPRPGRPAHQSSTPAAVATHRCPRGLPPTVVAVKTAVMTKINQQQHDVPLICNNTSRPPRQHPPASAGCLGNSKRQSRAKPRTLCAITSLREMSRGWLTSSGVYNWPVTHTDWLFHILTLDVPVKSLLVVLF